MRTIMLVTATLVAVSLAGCSDEPPSGEITSSGMGAAVEGHVHSAEYVTFDDPLAGNAANDAAGGCTGDDLPPPQAGQDDPFAAQRCRYASSELNYMIITLPDPAASGWQMAFSCNACTEPRGSPSAITGMAPGPWAWNHTSEEARGDNKQQTFDQFTLLLDGTPIAVSGIAGPSDSLAFVPELTTVSFAASYKGKDLTITVSGISAEDPIPVTGWLVNVDDVGVKTHAEEFAIAGNGEFMYTASKAIDSFQQVHIHLAGTNINIASGDVT